LFQGIKKRKSNLSNLKYDGMKMYVCLSFITFSSPYIDLHTDDMLQSNVYVYTSSKNIILSIIRPSWEYVYHTQAKKAIEMKKNSKCVRRAKIEFFFVVVCLSTSIKIFIGFFSLSLSPSHKYPLSLSNKFKYCRWVKYKNQQIRSLSYICIPFLLR
jgi:hypothetical protein